MNNGQRFQVSPHGIIGLAALSLILIIGIHMTGFRVVGAIKVGA